MGQEEAIPQSFRRRCVVVLTVLLLLFCFRVFAQLFQTWSPVAFLPPFEAWASGALPYWLLVLSQIFIIVLCSRVIWRMHKGLTVPSLARGKVLLILGFVYFSLMAARLIIGLTVATDHFWFSAWLPTLFHFVLASFVLVCGWFHCTTYSTADARSIGKTA